MAKNEVIVKPENLPQIQRLMRDLAPAIRMKVLKQVVLMGARDFHATAVRLAPVGFTGRLSDSLTVRRGRPTEGSMYDELARVIVSRSKGVFYAHLVEFGHMWVRRRGGRTYARGHTSANPFLMNTFDLDKDKISRKMLVKTRAKVIRLVNQRYVAAGMNRVPRGFATS